VESHESRPSALKLSDLNSNLLEQARRGAGLHIRAVQLAVELEVALLVFAGEGRVELRSQRLLEALELGPWQLRALVADGDLKIEVGQRAAVVAVHIRGRAAAGLRRVAAVAPGELDLHRVDLARTASQRSCTLERPRSNGVRSRVSRTAARRSTPSLMRASSSAVGAGG
jgi:hypothetical protein